MHFWIGKHLLTDISLIFLAFDMSDEKHVTNELPKDSTETKGRCIKIFTIYNHIIIMKNMSIMYTQYIQFNMTCTLVYVCVSGKKDQLVTQEVSLEGSVSWRTYHEYCKAAGGFYSLF